MVRALQHVAVMAVGFGVLLMLFPYYGFDSQPPQCFSVFNSRVPCDAPWLTYGALVMVVGLELVLARTNRRSAARRA